MLQWIEITISEPEKRTTTAMKMQDTFVVYLVETRYDLEAQIREFLMIILDDFLISPYNICCDPLVRTLSLRQF